MEPLGKCPVDIWGDLPEGCGVGKGGEREIYWSPLCSGWGPPGGTKEIISANSNRLCEMAGSANLDTLRVDGPAVAKGMKSIMGGTLVVQRR